MPDKNDAQAIINAATAAVEPTRLPLVTDDDLSTLLSVTTPEGAQHRLVDLEKYQPAPRRTHGVYRLHTVEELIRFAKSQNGYADAKASIWVDVKNSRVVVVFNDSKPGAPAWRDHRAELKLEHTPEWLHWLNPSVNGKLIGQESFAEHIEDGLEEIVDPDAATMLEIAQTFHATTAADFSSGTRLQSGEVQFSYVEETTATAGAKKGDVSIPLTIGLKISPFVGESPYEVEARFRYRAGANGLRLGYKVVRPERVLEDALTHVHDRLRTEFEPEAPGDTAVYLGVPPAAGNAA